MINYRGSIIHEFPIATTKLFGKDVAYSGGGYFRLFPYRLIEREMNKSPYSMAYFHLGDLSPVVSGMVSKEEYERYFGENGTLKARFLRYLKTNLGVKNNRKKLFRLLDHHKFVNLEDIDASIDWTKVPNIQL